MQLIVSPGQGHNMWTGFFQCQELLDFLIARASPAIRGRSTYGFSGGWGASSSARSAMLTATSPTRSRSWRR